MKINNEKIIFDTINSIGEKNVSKYLSLEEKINLRQIFSNYLNNGIKLDDSKLNSETLILLEYLFNDSEYNFIKNILPIENKDLVLSDYKSTDRTKYINIFKKLI